MPTIDASWYTRPPGVKDRLSAGGVVVRGRGNAIEIALAREGDFADYVLPKGGVEEGESLAEAARREIEEEAGLAGLEWRADLGARSRLTFDKKKWVTVHYFLFTAPPDAVAQTPTDTRKHRHPAAWFPIDGLPAMFWPEQRELVESNRAMIEAVVRA